MWCNLKFMRFHCFKPKLVKWWGQGSASGKKNIISELIINNVSGGTSQVKSIFVQDNCWRQTQCPSLTSFQVLSLCLLQHQSQLSLPFPRQIGHGCHFLFMSPFCSLSVLSEKKEQRRYRYIKSFLSNWSSDELNKREHWYVSDERINDIQSNLNCGPVFYYFYWHIM